MIEEDLVSKAYDLILSRILSLDLKPGSHISDFTLSRDFGISRTPIRSAIMKLESEGIVIGCKAGGFQVIEITDSLIDDFDKAMRIIYSALIDSSSNIPNDIKSKMLENLDSFKTSLKENSIDGISKSFIAFNTSFLMLSDNGILKGSIRNLMIIGELLFKYIASAISIEELNTILSFFSSLLDNDKEYSKKLLINTCNMLYGIQRKSRG